MTQSKVTGGWLQRLAKRWQVGAIAYRLYYAPKNVVQNTLQKGVINTALDAHYQRQMEQAAGTLPRLTFASDHEPLDIHFLTGSRFWYQTCFCAYSMARQTDLPLRPVIYDDGTLNSHHQEAIRRVFPNAQFFLKPELDSRIDQVLPSAKFPYLRDRRQHYPNIRKLTDVHAGSQGWKLVLDSDMLFFRPPTLLLQWLQSPQQPCHMVDTETAYGYPSSLMEALAGAPIRERLNVGICGLNSSDIDWDKLEFWCKTLIEKQGTHYYLEQALVAMLMAGKNCAVAPVDNYIVMPDQMEAVKPKAVLHHYVSGSKPWYFRYGWQHIATPHAFQEKA